MSPSERVGGYLTRAPSTVRYYGHWAAGLTVTVGGSGPWSARPGPAVEPEPPRAQWPVPSPIAGSSDWPRRPGPTTAYGHYY
eukprot:85570-Hanusia_phi.AAC.1